MLWPFALMAAADRINNMHVDSNGLTPEMKCSQAAASTVRLQNYHAFRRPVYVLDVRLQDAGGAGPPKCDPRSHLGIRVGHLPAHVGSVALVLNPRTRLLSPQFRVVFAEDFSTVPSLRNGPVPDNWHQLVRNSREKSTDGVYDVTKTWLIAEHDISAGKTTKVSDSTGDGIHAGTASVPAAMCPADTRVDHAVPSQAETPTDNSEGQSMLILQVLTSLLMVTQAPFQHLNQTCCQC